MDEKTRRQYVKLTEFLGQVLGPDYEVSLHDLGNDDNSVIAIANSHVTGRSVGSPMSEGMLRLVAEHGYSNHDYKVNLSGTAVREKLLRTSTFFIKDGSDELSGLLCINFDDSRYQALVDSVLKLRHPDAFVTTNFAYNQASDRVENAPGVKHNDSFAVSMRQMIQDVMRQMLSEKGTSARRLTQAEKLELVSELKRKGVFLMKGAVQQVARQLSCSQATLYRYLQRVTQEQENGGAEKGMGKSRTHRRIT